MNEEHLTKEGLPAEIFPVSVEEKLAPAVKEKIDHKARSHSILGGSSALRWVNCPGSVFYTKDLPPEEASEAALEGTAAHELAEMALSDYLDHLIEGTDPNIRLELSSADETMKEAVEGYVQAIWEIILEKSLTGKACGIEEFFVLDEPLDMAGTVDFWCVYIDDRGKRVGCVVDFKYGFHAIDAEKNAQLAFYACGLRKMLTDKGKDIDYVRAAIFQPRSGKKAYKETKFTKKVLIKWEEEFQKAAKRIFIDQKPKFKAGEWCRWCRAKGTCPTYKTSVETRTSLALIRPQEVKLPMPESLNDAQLAKIIVNSEAIFDFIKGCKDHAFSRHKLKNPIPGLKIVEGGTRKTWAENTSELENKLLSMGFCKGDICNYKVKGIGDLTKILKKNDYNGKILDEYITQTKPSLTIVSETDERPEVKTLLTQIEETT